MTKPKAAKKSGKMSDGNSVVPMMPGKHGGKLRRGSLPGNTPGTGRPPDRIKAAMRDKLELALPRLWKEYEDGKLDALGFANFLAKYGLQDKELVIASTNAASFFDCVHAAIVELCGEAMADQVKARALALMEAKP